MTDEVSGFSKEQISVLKSVIAKDLDDNQLSLFLMTCKRFQLDPFMKQIYAVVRRDRDGVPSMTIQTSIDGFRLQAERTGRYEGQLGPWWCDVDGVWVDVWLKKSPPAAARVGVVKKGWKEPIFAVARYDSYVATGRDGPTPMWRKMPDNQLAKCAEALALRKAFPAELSGLYSSDEMEQEENHPAALSPPQQPIVKQIAQTTQSPQPTEDNNKHAYCISIWKKFKDVAKLTHAESEIISKKYTGFPVSTWKGLSYESLDLLSSIVEKIISGEMSKHDALALMPDPVTKDAVEVFDSAEILEQHTNEQMEKTEPVAARKKRM